MFSKVVNILIKFTYPLIIVSALLSIQLSALRIRNFSIYELIIPIVLVVFVSFLYSFTRNINVSHCAIGLICILIFIYLLFSSEKYYFITAWDCGAVVNGANTLAYHESFDDYFLYFSRCSNNFFLTCIYSLFVRFIGIFASVDSFYACIILQSFLFSLSAYFLYRCGELISGIKAGVLTLLVYILFISVSPWVVIPYSDATGLIFPIIFLYLYLVSKKTLSKRMNVFIFILIGLLSFPAFKIKPQLIIMLIAIFIISITNKSLCLKQTVAFLLGLFISIISVTIFIDSFNINLDKNKEYSIWYYLCIGANTEHNGACNIDDQSFALSFEEKAERDQALQNLFFTRVKDNGIVGNIKHMMRKNRLNYSDGTFGWWQEDNGNFYRGEKDRNGSNVELFYKSFYYPNGTRHYLYVRYANVIWYSILLTSLLSVFSKSSSEILVVLLAIIGLSIFEMIFESRARYLFAYAPIYILCASCSISSFIFMFRNKPIQK